LTRGSRLLIDDPDADETIAYEVTKSDRVTGVHNGYGVYEYLVHEAALLPDDDTATMTPTPDEYQPGDPGVGGWF
jgi:hypothetical protein